MSSAHRSPDVRPVLDQDMVRGAAPILDALAEKLGQSCQLALCSDDGFFIGLQSAPANGCFVNMPVGLPYPSPAFDGGRPVRGLATYRPNASLPDVTDVCATVFRGSEPVALLIATLVNGRRAPSLDVCLRNVQAAADRLSQSLIMTALVA